MVFTPDVTLVSSTGKTFKFRGVAPFRSKKSQPVISIPLPNAKPHQTILFRFAGQTEEVNFTFALWDDGEDVSAGAGINTIEEQIQYLRDTVYDSQFDSSWVITQDRYYPTGLSDPRNVVITDLQFDNAAGGVTLVIGQISMKRGSIGSLS